MKRNIQEALENWKFDPMRKPLILEGARQVGKTTNLERFAESYESRAIFNFEREQSLAAFFEGSLDPQQIVKLLSIHSGVQIEAGKTLIVFDEVQECPNALNSLKYFCEDAREHHLVAAGSLLGVKMAQTKGFPVGKVNFLKMYPLTFFEFLDALNESSLREYLESYTSFVPLPEPLHNKLMSYLREYLFVGGMPEAVATYRDTQDYEKARTVQYSILEAYQRDFAKHAPPNQIMKIMTVWENVHRQLAKENKKFIFSAIRKSARGRDFEDAMQWLLEAGIIYKSYHLRKPGLPIDAYVDHNIFKIFMLDVGLLSARSNLAAKIIIEGNNVFSKFKGALTENFVAQELIASGDKGLYYWTSTGTAELDFVKEKNQIIYPIEVKSGAIAKKKSLLSYASKHPKAILSRTTPMNLKHDGKIFNYPLYMISQFPLV